MSATPPADPPSASMGQFLDQALWDRLRATFQRAVSHRAAAEDLTQELLAKLVAGGSLERFVERERPTAEHLWNFLARCARNHLADHFRRLGSRRQQPWTARVSLDGGRDDAPLAGHASTADDPARAMQLRELEQAAERGEARLAHEFGRRGKGHVFSALRPFLRDRGPDGTADASTSLGRVAGLAPGAARVCLSRARKRFRELAREMLLDGGVPNPRLREA